MGNGKKSTVYIRPGRTPWIRLSIQIGEVPGSAQACDEGGKSFFDLEPSGVDFVFRLNFQGTLLPTQAFAKDMVERKHGCILNISSMNAVAHGGILCHIWAFVNVYNAQKLFLCRVLTNGNLWCMMLP